MCAFVRPLGKLCDISVGPGYDDTGIRPWNRENYRSRRYVRSTLMKTGYIISGDAQCVRYCTCDDYVWYSTTVVQVCPESHIDALVLMCATSYILQRWTILRKLMGQSHRCQS